MREDKRIAKTKEKIRAGVIRIVLERGYESITMQEIALAAGVGRKTIYRHYENKEALLSDLVLSLAMEVQGKVAGLVEEEDKTVVLFQQIRVHQQLFRLLADPHVMLLFMGQLHAFIQQLPMMQLLQEQAKKKGVPPEFVLGHFATSLITTGRWWLENGCEPEPEEMAGWLMELVYRPLRAFVGDGGIGRGSPGLPGLGGSEGGEI